MDALRQNLRYALRTMRRSPGFTLTVLLTLGIGIGANTAIFSFVDTLLLRPLPYEDPDRIVMVWEDFGSTGGPEQEWFTPPDFRDVQAATSLEAVAGLVNWGPSLTGEGEPERLVGATVSPAWFDVVRVNPALGRAFRAEEDRGDGRVVVLSHALWQRRFGGEGGVVGRTVQLNGVAHEVVGVMPEDFAPPFMVGTELWRPFTSTSFSEGCMNSRGCYVMRTIARIRADVSLEQVQAELDGIAAAIREQAPGDKAGMALDAVRLQDQVTGPVQPALLALMGAVGLLLLIACVNIANLLLARSASREREVAVRTAIGARRGAILRQLLVESGVLGLSGGAVGILLSLWGVQLLRGMSPAGTPRLEDVAVDGRVLLFALALSLLTGVLFGLAPAAQLVRTDLSRALREAAGPRTSGSRRRMRSALVVVELAIAMTLLAGAGLLMRSFLHIQAVDPGFQPENVLVANIALPASRYPDAARSAALFEELANGLAARDGIVAAGASTIVPLSGGDTDVGFVIEGRPLPQSNVDAPTAWYRQVTPGYLEAMGIRLLRGRGIEATDRPGTPQVGLVNETLARRLWPQGDAIGARISAEGPDGPWTTIVGIVGDVRQLGPDQPARGELFLPLAQVPSGGTALVVRTTGDPLAALPAVRAAVRDIDPDVPVANITTMDEAMRQATALPRLYISFFGFFALVALVLAAIGIYGVTSYAVSQRTPEIGVRMALGAAAGDVLRLVLGQALVLVGAGLLTGLVLALALSRLLTGLLFDLSPTDPVTFVVIGGILALVALVASWLPAHRATRVNPLRALRTDA